MKRIIKSVTTTLILALFLVPNFSVKASESEEVISLENVEQIFSGNPESLEEFKKLSNEDQEEFIESLKDPEMFNENLEVEVEETVKEEPMLPNLDSNLAYSRAATTYRTTLTSRYHMKILNVNITTYRHELVYSRSGGKATKILANTGVVERSINPMVATGLSSKSSYISNGRAYGTTDFYYNIGPFKGMSIQIGNLHHKLVGDGQGKITTSSWIKQ